MTRTPQHRYPNINLDLLHENIRCSLQEAELFNSARACISVPEMWALGSVLTRCRQLYDEQQQQQQKTQSQMLIARHPPLINSLIVPYDIWHRGKPESP